LYSEGHQGQYVAPVLCGHALQLFSMGWTATP
jgi:hypothetical protein